MSMTPQRWLIPLCLFSFLSFFYYIGLGDYGLFDPWETHYGEVARDMVERGNYIDSFWGSPWDSGEVKRERSGFYSKPPLTMWLMSIGMNFFGFNALGIRALFPLLGLFALLSIYLAMLRLSSQSAAVFTTLCTAFTPSFSFLSHQAVTDGPMVAIIIMGMMALCLALSPQSNQRASKTLAYFTLGLVSLTIMAQLWVIWPMNRSPDAIYSYSEYSALSQFNSSMVQLWAIARGKGWFWVAVLAPLALLFLNQLRQEKQAREYYFILFFLACGLTVPAKGWLGWAPMGGALFFYLLISKEWHWLSLRRVGRGLGIVFFTGHIWVLAMLGGHHPHWVNRFIYHDHINRLFKGVHSTDDGAFEYFFQWLAYGIYPLVALLPIALVYVFNREKELQSIEKPQKYLSERSLILLISLWALVSFTLFSKSNTKFHHYIFPSVPAFTLLIGLTLSAIWRGQFQWSKQVTLVLIGTLLWVGSDVATPSSAPGQGAQHWVNLFTYKYDRDWPTMPTQGEIDSLRREAAAQAWQSTLSLPLTQDQLRSHSVELNQRLKDQEWNETLVYPIQWLSLLMLMSLLAFSARALLLRRIGVVGTLLASLWISYYSLHLYLPTIAKHWSQWELWNEYYSRCGSFKQDDPQDELQFRRQLLKFSERIPRHLDTLPSWCKAPAIAFRMNWRGEAFYTHNTVVPALYTKDLKPILQTWGVWDEWQEGKKFYMFTERSRIKSELERSLPRYMRGQYKEVFGEDRRFVLLEFDLDFKDKTLK